MKIDFMTNLFLFYFIGTVITLILSAFTVEYAIVGYLSYPLFLLFYTIIKLVKSIKITNFRKKRNSKYSNT